MVSFFCDLGDIKITSLSNQRCSSAHLGRDYVHSMAVISNWQPRGWIRLTTGFQKWLTVIKMIRAWHIKAENAFSFVKKWKKCKRWNWGGISFQQMQDVELLSIAFSLQEKLSIGMMSTAFQQRVGWKAVPHFNITHFLAGKAKCWNADAKCFNIIIMWCQK